MPLRLEEIGFNHDENSADTDAINIRKNQSEFVDVPEWRRDRSLNPEDSPAAYSLAETRGRQLTIRAGFSYDDHDGRPLEIRAVDASLDPDPSPSFVLSSLAELLLRPLRPGRAGNILGEVKARPVTPIRGQIFSETFELVNVRIRDFGVGRQDIEWRWQYRLGPAGAWTEFATSRHRIYTVLSSPEPPWLREPHSRSETRLAWAEVLDYACTWAAGAKNTDDAAERIARYVNERLGLLKYTGSAHYTDDRNFDCRAFLNLLRGKKGKGRQVNCDDCAAIVYTFANIIGCQLSHMSIEPIRGQASRIRCKPVIHIGIGGWQERTQYVYHAVASEGGCDEDDEVFDAAFKVAARDDPNPQTRVPLLATNLPYLRAGRPHYRSRLVLQQFEGTCAPDPADCPPKLPRAARRLGPRCENILRLVKEEHGFEEHGFDDGERAAAAGARRFILEFFFADYVLPRWRPVQISEFPRGETLEEPAVVQSFWERAQQGAYERFRADVFECDSWEEARRGVAAALTWFQESDMTRRKLPGLGDVVFANETFSTILAAAGNLVYLLRGEGDEDASLMEAAESLSRAVLDPPRAGGEAEDEARGRRLFRLSSTESKVDDEVPIESAPPDPLSRRRLYQFVADKGEVFRRGESLIYRPRAPGLNRLEIFALDARGRALKQVLELTARP